MQDQLTTLQLSDFIPTQKDFKENLINKDENSLNLQNSDNETLQIPIYTNSKRKYFSKKEDKLLMDAVINLKKESWNDIAKCVPGRTSKQCRDRWVNYLQPSLKFDPWTNSDDQLLVSLVNKFGTHWSQMKEYFPSRSANSIKNRWRLLIKYNVRALPIEKLIISALSNFSEDTKQNKFTQNLKSKIINLDSLNPKIINSEKDNSLEFYFLVNDDQKGSDSFLINQNNNLKIDCSSSENLKHTNESDDDLITFTQEELEW